MYNSMYWHSFTCTICFVHWVDGYLVARMSTCGPCTCMGMCDQGTTIKCCVRESKLFSTSKHPLLSDIRRAQISGVRISDI